MISTDILELDNIIVQSQGNVVSNMDGEKVMMSIQNGKYYNLGEIGGRIWDMIEKPTSVNNLIVNLISEYNIEKSDCEQQVVSFLASLKKEGLINIQKGKKS
ncbi:lasso peptide biosynthesis PqqD family chaperone [Neobacillus sp. NPDC093182]|uniref:lasso peptide biosynthesis PqqD family chaperone n=1 Tax=Neobacillus sp. NPDC093182 TaxID=3364297 RepID=UPI003820CA9A